MFLKRKTVDQAMQISDEMRLQQSAISRLRVDRANTVSDFGETDPQLDRELLRLQVQFEINEHRLALVIKKRQLKALEV